MKFSIRKSTLCNCIALLIMFPSVDSVFTFKFWAVLVLLVSAVFFSKNESSTANDRSAA